MMKIDIFKNFDENKKRLYPIESIPFLENCLKVIDKEFDETLNLDLQFTSLKKKEYEKILFHIINNILEKEFEKRDSSEKYIFSKILQSYVFEQLDIFFYSNMYLNKKRREKKTKIDGILKYIYSLKTDNYIVSNEIYLDVEGTILKTSKKIIDESKKKTKRIRQAILINNVNYLKEKQKDTKEEIKKKQK